MDINERISRITCEAFEGLLNGAVVSAVSVDPTGDGQEAELVAVIGFSGSQARGVIGLSATPDVIRALYPREDSRDDLGEAELADWTGELANQLLGRLKLDLMRRGVQLWMATPVVLRGVSVHVASSRTAVRKFRFDVDAGVFWAWLDLTLDESVDLESNETTGPGAGDMLFF